MIFASVFHLSNCVLFGISFISYIPVYASFLIAPLLDKKPDINWRLLMVIVAVVALTKLFLTFLGVNMLIKESVWNIYLAILFWVALIVMSTRITFMKRTISL